MILVSGATGNVGKELVNLLIDRGVPVRVLVRDERKVAHLRRRAEIAVGDLDRPESIAPALRGVEQLYLVTPVTEQVAALLEAARRAGVRHVVKQSTIEADRRLGPGRWHREQEELVESLGFAWTFIRPTMFMSNTIEWWSPTIKAQNAVYFPGGKGRVPPVDARDVAAVAAAILTHPGHAGRVYEVTGPRALSIAEMVQVLAGVLDKPLRYVNVPAFLAGMWMRRFGMSPELVRALMDTLGALRRNEYAYVTDAVAQVGGVQPQTFEAWCRENAGAFRN